MKIAHIITIFLLLFGLIPSYAQASEVIFVSPTRVDLNDKTKVVVMNVTNVSDITRSYKVGIRNVVMTENGSTTTVDDFPYSAKK